MFSVLMRAFSFTLIIIIGIVMKSTGFVPKDAGASVKKLSDLCNTSCIYYHQFLCNRGYGI